MTRLNELTLRKSVLGLGTILRRLFAPVGALFSKIASIGIAGYPADTQRRLKITNVVASLISTTTFIYAIQLAMSDYELMKPVVWINVALAAFSACVPLAHRINDIAGGMLLVAAEFIALLGFTAFFGRSAGAPMQYIVAAAAPFVIFGLNRMK